MKRIHIVFLLLTMVSPATYAAQQRLIKKITVIANGQPDTRVLDAGPEAKKLHDATAQAIRGKFRPLQELLIDERVNPDSPRGGRTPLHMLTEPLKSPKPSDAERWNIDRAALLFWQAQARSNK